MIQSIIAKQNNNDIKLENNLIIKKNRIFNEGASGRSEIWSAIIKKSKEVTYRILYLNLLIINLGLLKVKSY